MQIHELITSVYLEPIQFNNANANVLKYIDNNIQDNVINGLYVNQVLNVRILANPKVLLNGNVKYDVECKCEVIDPVVGSTLPFTVTSVNKVGYFSKDKKISYFMPLHYSKKTLNINDQIDVVVVGKRIEDNIVCIVKSCN